MASALAQADDDDWVCGRPEQRPAGDTHDREQHARVRACGGPGGGGGGASGAGGAGYDPHPQGRRAKKRSAALAAFIAAEPDATDADDNADGSDADDYVPPAKRSKTQAHGRVQRGAAKATQEPKVKLSLNPRCGHSSREATGGNGSGVVDGCGGGNCGNSSSVLTGMPSQPTQAQAQAHAQEQQQQQTQHQHAQASADTQARGQLVQEAAAQRHAAEEEATGRQVCAPYDFQARSAALAYLVALKAALDGGDVDPHGYQQEYDRMAAYLGMH
ncbi:hypothetical protein FOA52_014138 [Chlamydomonas sp. UWO 241]|nr:hypothetical protein FOA52_014138 [Chlamydomonas sp. UWO 241]